jgi:hypothetical protein
MNPDGGATSSTLILTVADLRDPLLEYLRSRHLQAALQAASELNFVRRDKTDRVEYADVQAGDERTFVEQVKLDRWDAGAQDAGAHHEQLHLLLVPEDPTAGVDKVSFRAALACAHPGDNLRILGPTFSGSAWSLASLLKAAGLQSVPVISGSATGDGVGDVFDRLQLQPFHRTVHSNGALASGFASYLWKLTGEDVPFALLVETASDYGQSFRGSLSSKLKKTRVLPFPLHVAWLLGEGSDLLPSRAEDQEQSHPSGDAGVQHVHFARPSAIERASARASLETLLTAVSRDGFGYVGIVATDVRDRLFLAQEVHQFLPDVRVVLFESDVLYAAGRATDLPPGTLVVSTYALATNHHAVDTSPGMQFESDASLGIYNAMLLLLEQADAKGAQAPLLEYAHETMPDGGFNQPPVWISLVGARSTWPLAENFEDIGTDRSLVLDPRPHPLDIPNRGPTQFDLVAALCALVLLIIQSWFFLGPPPPELAARHSILPAFADPLSGEWGPTLVYCGMAAAWVAGLSLLIHLLLHVHLTGHPALHQVAVTSVSLAIAGAVLAISTSLSSLIYSTKSLKEDSRKSVLSRLLSTGSDEVRARRWLVASVTAVGTGAVIALSLRHTKDASDVLARARTTYLWNGVSVLPCVLLVLTAVTLLALFYAAYRGLLIRESAKPVRIWDQANRSARGGLLLLSTLLVAVPMALLIWPAQSQFEILPVVRCLLGLLYLSPLALMSFYAIAFIRVLDLQEKRKSEREERAKAEASAVRVLALAPVLAAPVLLVASWSFPFVAQRLMVLVFATLGVAFVLLYFALVFLMQAFKPAGDAQKVRGWDVLRLALAAIPTIITLVGLKFPDTGNAVISWLQQVGAIVK